MSREATQFKPGQSGNPDGRPKGIKNRLTTNFLEALADDFEQGGVEAIQQARVNDPTGYLRVFASMVPRELELGGDSNVYVLIGRAPAGSEADWVEKHGAEAIEHQPTNGKGNGRE